MNLNGAKRELEKLLEQNRPPDYLRVVEDETRPGWVWIYWGRLRVALIPKQLWETL